MIAMHLHLKMVSSIIYFGRFLLQDLRNNDFEVF